MGLDITAYRKLVPAPNAARDTDGYPKDGKTHFLAHPLSVAFTEENWPGQSAGVVPDMAYTFADSFGFRAGSYGGYNAWRDWLARVAGWAGAKECWKSKTPSERPFAELINFADNEGVIGPSVAAKLAKDFADNEPRAVALDDDGLWPIELYRKWRRAFEMAADGGAVDFH